VAMIHRMRIYIQNNAIEHPQKNLF
jgi:hypothetical protein